MYQAIEAIRQGSDAVSSLTARRESVGMEKK